MNIASEIRWLQSQAVPDSMCQCQTEMIINRSEDPVRMRSSLMTLVFIDQFVFTHFQNKYPHFKEEFPIPKLYSHSAAGMASPSWFAYKQVGVRLNFPLLIKLIKWLRNGYETLVAEIESTFDEPSSIVKLTAEEIKDLRGEVLLGCKKNLLRFHDQNQPYYRAKERFRKSQLAFIKEEFDLTLDDQEELAEYLNDMLDLTRFNTDMIDIEIAMEICTLASFKQRK